MNAVELSKYIVLKCIDDGKPVSNLQLQNILYYVQKDFLQKKNKQAFYDDIEAWQFGPAVPNVYYRYCGFGAMRITIVNPNDVPHISYKDKFFIDAIIDEKRELNPWDMVEEIHKSGGAWDCSVRMGNRHVIPADLIRVVG